MKHYIIVGETLREVMYVFDYMARLLRDKIASVSKLRRMIYIDEYCLHFMSEEQYYRDGCRGFHYEAFNASYVERMLDRYKVLAGK